MSSTQENIDSLKIAIKTNNIEDVKKILLNLDVTVPDNDGWNYLMYSIHFCSSAEILTLLCQKMFEVGGSVLLKSQLSAKEDLLMFSCKYASSTTIMKLLASLLFHFGLFQRQYEKLDGYGKGALEEKIGIDSSWTPSLHLEIETIKLVFSDIKRIGGDQLLKDFLAKEYNAGERCLLSVCTSSRSHQDRLKLVLETMEEVSEEFLVEQISKRRGTDGMTCLYALCKFAPNCDSLLLLVGKIFEAENLGRRYLRKEVLQHPYLLESILSRPFDSDDEKKILFLIVNIYSITGTFEEKYLCLDEEQKKKLQLCKIESGEWSRARSIDSTMCDLIGEIKKSIHKNK